MLNLAHNMACYILVLIVENVNFECAAGNECRVSVRGKGFLWWEPEVKLCQPVLKCVHLFTKETKILEVNLIKIR